MSHEKIAERIRKLLALAHGEGATEGEVENALRFARQLMEKHGLEEADVIMSDAAKLDIVEETGYEVAGIGPWERSLASTVGIVCDVKTYRLRGYKEQMRFVGFRKDVAVAVELYKTLLVTVRTMARSRYGAGWRLSEHGSYAHGFVSGMYLKARTMSSSADDCKAIVLRKTTVIADWIAENLGPMKTKKAIVSKVSSEAYNKGHTDGSRVNLTTKALT